MVQVPSLSHLQPLVCVLSTALPLQLVCTVFQLPSFSLPSTLPPPLSLLPSLLLSPSYPPSSSLPPTLPPPLSLLPSLLLSPSYPPSSLSHSFSPLSLRYVLLPSHLSTHWNKIGVLSQALNLLEDMRKKQALPSDEVCVV